MKPVSRTRLIAAVVTAGAGLFLAASLVSFHPADPPSEALYPPNAPVQNWCGDAGAYVAHFLFASLGDAAYPLALFLMAGAMLWLSQTSLDSKIFRVIGAAMLILVVAVVSAMIPAEARLPEGNGGALGLAAWMYVAPRLGAFGTVLLLIPTAVVGLLLMTDTWLIILPLIALKWIRDRAHAPYRRLATAALATAGAAGAKLADFAGTTQAREAETRPRARKQRRARCDEDETDDEADDGASVATALAAVQATATRDADADEAAEEVASPPPPPRHVIIRHAHSPPKTGDGDEKEDGFTFTPPPSTPRNQDYQLPPVDLLEAPDEAVGGEDEDTIRAQAKVLTETLREFGVAAEVVAVETGPVITQYEVALAPGIKVGKVIGLSDDLAIAMKAANVRIVAPLPGKDTIGVEVPNTLRQIVRLKEIVLAARSAPQRLGLPLFLGKDSGGEPLVKDLAAMPHLLIGGTTGSGKSVCLNSIIMSLLLTRTPEDLRLILIDPKMVELSVFKKLPHLLCPVVNEMRKAEAILAWLVDKMEDRYRLLSRAGVRNIAAYNRMGREKLIERFAPASPEEEARIEVHLPHIVVIVDELADLMMVAAKEVETHVTRLSQKSRAVGIHLVMATQRPSVDVLTGLIKSNLPVRVAFQTASRIDSRTILDSMGAEKLLGQGDLLFMTPGASKFARAQGAYVSDLDIQNVLDHITDKAEPEFQRELVQLKADDGTGDGDDGLLAVGADDELYAKAIEIILQYERGSVSLLQRRLGIGYGRAARLIDQMAEDGIVGAYKGSQARETLITLEQWEALRQRRRDDENPDDTHLTDEETDMET
ncbi:MAG: DNA translocase FtsK [Planctomycetes bacterium]|nr:DNA translocase FtsK [Planctomycetota bacterium]